MSHLLETMPKSKKNPKTNDQKSDQPKDKWEKNNKVKNNNNNYNNNNNTNDNNKYGNNEIIFHYNKYGITEFPVSLSNSTPSPPPESNEVTSKEPIKRRYTSPLRKDISKDTLSKFGANINVPNSSSASSHDVSPLSIVGKESNRRKTHDGTHGRNRGRDSNRDKNRDHDRERRSKKRREFVPGDIRLPTAKTLSKLGLTACGDLPVVTPSPVVDVELPTTTSRRRNSVDLTNKKAGPECAPTKRLSSDFATELPPHESMDYDHSNLDEDIFADEHKEGFDDSSDEDGNGGDKKKMKKIRPMPPLQPLGTNVSSSRRLVVRQGTTYSEDNTVVLNMFFREINKIDKLGEYRPKGNDPILESMSEILFKPYPWPLKVFGALICLSQFLTLVCLFYSLLPCPEEKPSWLVFVGVPLACAYAGIESIHHMLRYIHLGKGYRGLVFLMNLNSVMQLLCVGVVMGKSINLLTLISNFVGVAVVLQIDEFLASYVRIKDIDPELLGDKSWRTKMRLKSKIFLVLIAACIVYAVTAAIWKVDSMYCDAYDFERYQ